MATKMAMPTTRLVYFNLTGLGEPVRFILSYCGEYFVDERISFEDWGRRKSSFPYGTLPYLEIDDVKIHQSMAMCRYLANKHGIAGNTPEDKVKADQMADTVNDVRSGLARWFFEKDESVKEKKREEVLKNAKYYIERLEQHVNNTGGYLVLQDQLTWADLVFGSFTPLLNHFAGHDLFADRPHLKQLSDKIRSLPAIKTYLDNRPPHPF